MMRDQITGFADHTTIRATRNSGARHAFGGGGAEFDFKIVEGYDNHTEVGKMYDMYGTGDDFAKHGELLGSLVECNESRVYNGTVRRRRSEE